MLDDGRARRACPERGEKRAVRLDGDDRSGAPPQRLRLDDLPDLLCVDEVAVILRLSPEAVRQRICRGHLPVLKLGPAPADPSLPDRRPVRVLRGAVLAFLGLPVDSSAPQSDARPVARRRRPRGE